MQSLKALLAALVIAGTWSAAAQAQSLEDMAWLEGRWNSADGTVSEWWLPSDGRAMAATFRWTWDSRTILEFITLTEEAGEVLYRFRHYDPDNTPWEPEDPNVYVLTESEPGLAVFALRASGGDDAPGHLIYRREQETLFVCVDGRERAMEGCGGFELELHRAPDGSQ